MNHPHALPVTVYQAFLEALDPEANSAARLEALRAHIANLARPGLEDFFASAAAYRLQRKKDAWEQRLGSAGHDQALFECLAETLGYSANRDAMISLARRVPITALSPDKAEALLFGAAGFLVPVLDEACDAETRAYHKDLWGCWWAEREHVENSSIPKPAWTTHGIRPANHPQRRVAALALLTYQWQAFSGLCRVVTARSLMRLTNSLQHPYWSHHFTLPSARFDKPVALFGRDRALDFIINHVVAIDDSRESWTGYLALPGPAPGKRVLETARKIIDDTKHVDALVRKAFIQQALLQIRQDCGY